MAKQHEEYIALFLEKNKDKSYIASELVDELVEKFPTLKKNNCRRIIFNAQSHDLISSSYPITFANNQYAYFSKKNQYGYLILVNCIKKYKKPLHRVIFALERNNGIITKLDACKISGVTLAADSHSVSYESIIGELKALNLVEVKKIEDSDYIIYKNKQLDTDTIAKIRIEQKNINLLLFLSLNWLIHANLIDFQQLCYFGELNNYNGVERNNEIWDAFGFSNAVGLGSNTREYQTLAVFDFLPNHVYEEYDFLGFKERVDRIIFSTHGENRKVLPIIFSSDISPSAYALIKSAGYLYFSLTTLLGDNAVSIARNYTSNITSIENKLGNQNGDISEEITSSLAEIRGSGNEVNYGNLKGQLFEYLMYPVIQKVYGQEGLITHGYTGSVKGKKFECDYLVKTMDEHIIIELKGYKKGNIILKGEYNQKTKKYTPNSILWFLNQTFSLCSQKLGKEIPVKLCYITTADLEEDAKKELTSRKKNKPNKLDSFYNFDSLIALLKEYNMKNEIKVIEQFYV